jgi:hypothetical protein
MRLLIFFVFVLAAAPSVASAASLRLSINMASYHTQEWARESLNQENPGIGLELRQSRSWAFSGGFYVNSYRRTTAYALAQWTPLQVGRQVSWHVDAGVVVGTATGYSRTEVPCAPLMGAFALRIAAPRSYVEVVLVGVPNIGAGQSGFIGLQLSLPFNDRL